MQRHHSSQALWNSPEWSTPVVASSADAVRQWQSLVRSPEGSSRAHTPIAPPTQAAFHRKGSLPAPATPRREEAPRRARRRTSASSGSVLSDRKGIARDRDGPVPAAVRNTRSKGGRPNSRSSQKSHTSSAPARKASFSVQPPVKAIGASPPDKLDGDEALLLCGVQPGSPKALWYITMRAQLEARRLAAASDDVAGGLGGPAGSTGTSTHYLPHRGQDGGPGPLVLPTELLLLSDLTSCHPLVPHRAPMVPHSPHKKVLSERSESECDAGVGSVGVFSSTFTDSEREANTLEQDTLPPQESLPLIMESLRVKATPHTHPPIQRLLLPNLRPPPEVLTVTRVKVLSL